MSKRATMEDEDHPQGGEIDLRALGQGVWRRKSWVIVPTLLAALGAFVFVQFSSPYYRSSSLVLIENRQSVVPTGATTEKEIQLPDEQAVASQVQLIQSRDLVRDVVKTLDLDKNPEFAKPSLSERLLGLVGMSGGDKQALNERVVDRVAENMLVYPITGSRVVGLEFVSTNPDTAAKFVNTLVDNYLDIQRGAKRDTNKQASQYLSDEISSLRGRVAEAEERVENFRAKAGLLVGTNNTTVAAQQLGDTTTQLSTARTQQAEAQAKAEMMRAVLKQGRPSEALDIANSELVRQLAQRRSELAAQIASEGRTLLPQHPRMRELSAQLQGLDEQVRSEAEKLARAFENDAKTAGARVAALTKQLDDLKVDAASANGQDVQLRALEREARSQRELLEQMLTRYRESSARDNPDALLADARVISRGAAATEPYFPKKIPTIALATITAFVLSLFAAAAAELFGGSRVEAGRASPPPSVGEIPVFGRLRGVVAKVAPSKSDREAAPIPAAAPVAVVPVAMAPTQKPTESVAPLRAVDSKSSVKLDAIECADQTLVAALARELAAMPSAEGALRIVTTGAKRGLMVAPIAANLAATISESGRRVVAVDAGGGPLHTGDVESGPGLSELLSGEATFAQAIHRDRGSRVHVVPAGAESFERLDAAAQSRLGVVIEALALTYDFVMISSPSGPGGADAFAPYCSAAVLVSDGGAADVVTVEAHERLKSIGIEDVVVLLMPNGDDRPRGRSREAA